MANVNHKTDIAAEQIHELQELGYDREEPQSNKIAILVILGSILLVVIIGALEYYFEYIKNEQMYTNVLSKQSDQLREVRAKEDTDLNSYKYVNKEKGVVQIPIERSMEVLIKEAEQGTLQKSTLLVPVVPPAQPGADQSAQPAAGSSPANTTPASGAPSTDAVTPAPQTEAKPK
ncbi:MAG: hypothetical protein JNN15_02630 [Blastocatellia bacterium]|nr:hypothetical protein [Blastocatellia bacterium]